MAKKKVDRVPGPTRVVLCGSSRFKEKHLECLKQETLAGKIVLIMGLYGHQDGLDMGSDTKRMLDELHLRKIDLADEVLVVNAYPEECLNCKKVTHLKESKSHGPVSACCGTKTRTGGLPYVGESTQREVDYARACGKPVRFLNELPPEAE